MPILQPISPSLNAAPCVAGSASTASVITFWELLNKINNDQLDRVVCDALRELQGEAPEAIAVDTGASKTSCTSRWTPPIVKITIAYANITGLIHSLP